MARIHEAVKKGSLHDLRLCLAKGDNFYALDDEGNTPLEIAKKRRNIEITKFLVIKHAVDEKYIEANEDEDKQTIINKLITTLLYKSNRHGWNSVVHDFIYSLFGFFQVFHVIVYCFYQFWCLHIHTQQMAQ